LEFKRRAIEYLAFDDKSRAAELPLPEGRRPGMVFADRRTAPSEYSPHALT
jgi:hypothetical protein